MHTDYWNHHEEDQPHMRPFHIPDTGRLSGLLIAAATQDKGHVFDPNSLAGQKGAITGRTRAEVLSSLAVNQIVSPLDYLSPKEQLE